MPGVVLHGAGHYVRCEAETARRLLELEGIAVLTTGAAGAGLGLTGASRYFVAPLAIGAFAGVSLFTFTLLADIYGAAGLSSVTGRALRTTPRLQLEGGLSYIYDPQFGYRALVSQGFRLDTPALWLAPRFDAALDDRNQRIELRAGHRFFGPRADRAGRDGSHLDFEVGTMDHAYVTDGFSLSTVEAQLAARLDLERVAPTLLGSFVEGSVGYARQWTRIDGLPSDGNDELLLRSAFGVYLGRGKVHGEALVAYDHRRDTYAGGLRMAGIAAGYLGFLEQRSELFFGRIGVRTELKYGSAFIAGVSLLLKVSP